MFGRSIEGAEIGASAEASRGGGQHGAEPDEQEDQTAELREHTRALTTAPRWAHRSFFNGVEDFAGVQNPRRVKDLFYPPHQRNLGGRSRVVQKVLLQESDPVLG